MDCTIKDRNLIISTCIYYGWIKKTNIMKFKGSKSEWKLEIDKSKKHDVQKHKINNGSHQIDIWGDTKNPKEGISNAKLVLVSRELLEGCIKLAAYIQSEYDVPENVIGFKDAIKAINYANS